MADSDPSSAGRPSGFSRLVPSRAPEDLREDPLLAILPRDADGRPVVGRIPILCRLGRGGMGAVYYSIHPRLNVEVAVKLLPPDLADQNPKLIERFVSEARLAVALENEHVVRVYDVDCEGKTHFLVMQYVEGESAGAFLKRRKAEGRTALDESEALAIVTAATRGLAAAHARGIIHRDIKPDNILIPRGELAKAKLADLGLAKPEGGEASLGTMSHVAMGTPGYMAPEQAEDAKTAGAAADVFSMGATLYALLTGRAPFAGSSLAVVLRDTAMKDPAPLPGQVSAGTRAVVERCLAKDPKARFANGAALLAALERGAEALPTPVTAPAAYEPTLMPMPEVKPRKAWILPAAVGAVLLIAGAVWFAVRPGEKPPVRPGPVAPAEDPGKKERAEKIAKILKQVESLEEQGRLDDALETLMRARALDPDDAKVREAQGRIEGKVQLARTAELNRLQKEGALRQQALEMQQRDWSLAREAEAKGDLDGAIALAAKAAAGPASRELAQYQAKLTEKRRERERLAARKKEFDEWAAQARAEKDPAMALAMWKRAEGLADEPTDKAEVAGQLDRLRGEMMKVEEDRRLQEESDRRWVYEQAMAGGKAAEQAGNFTKAIEAYREALKAKAGDPEAIAALQRIEKVLGMTPGNVVLDLGRGVKMEFVLIKAGKFMMGSDDFAGEKPVHEVTLTKDFWMQTTETTQAQWQAVMGANPSRFRGADLPVEQVTWEDCQGFLKQLTEKVKGQLAGRTAGLPTEAQWEHACRAGSTTKWSFGDDESKLGEHAWYERNSDKKTHPVGQRKPNAWGLYDMHGNVWEWCEDWYRMYGGKETDPTGPTRGELRCIRGACWDNVPINVRSANRNWYKPSQGHSTLGLRCVLRQP